MPADLLKLKVVFQSQIAFQKASTLLCAISMLTFVGGRADRVRRDGCMISGTSPVKLRRRERLPAGGPRLFRPLSSGEQWSGWRLSELPHVLFSRREPAISRSPAGKRR